MFPPAFVEPTRDSSPSEPRERSVDVEASSVPVSVVLSRKLKPAKEPAIPTVPMRSKSTKGGLARTTLRSRKREKETRERDEKNEAGELDGAMVVNWTYGGTLGG